MVVDVINLGLTSISSFDIDFDYNGITISENISGVNIPMLSSYSVVFNNPIVLTGGLNPATATISNVNGLGPDNVPANDLTTSQISIVDFYSK